ncbi:neuromedin-U receptor 1-like [Toxorhynchites rutilus septentrionalis]|uniref:neuromedin-U receptor 1-like n=1 Tax=Toxorhynchites rutilus septentrionalis TaxID=329112 RepID=UPI002479D591|nr:neuromedin-U receptor 1-like [Toxorhynchites rutilus septentrionalis]
MLSTNETYGMKQVAIRHENETFAPVIINTTTVLDLIYAGESGLPSDMTSANHGGVYDNTIDNLTAIYGPKRDPLYVVIPITIVYVLIFLTGVVGNISTCIVIAKNKSMHTATNYYLFSLAISDFLLLVSGVPQEIYFIWSKYPYIFGELFCVVRGIAAETSANATVLTITAFTVERYVAICHPFLSHTMSKLSRAIRFIFAVWIVAIVSAVPQALQFGVTNQSGVDQCVVKRIIIQHSFELSTFLFFFAPMTLITVLYALIGLKLRSSTMMQRDGTLQRRCNACPNARQQGTSQGTRRVLKMLVAVVVAFFICWAPFHAQRLVYIYGVDKDHQPSDPLILKLFVITTYISGILYYLSTCINPLLYNIMSNKFRQAFKETLAHGCHIARKPHGEERPYRILSRRKRRSISNKESSEFSGNSIKDDSLYSSSTQKQSIDSIAPSRGHSIKRCGRDHHRSTPAEREVGSTTERSNTATQRHPSQIVVTSSAHLNLYTEERELFLNIFPSNDSLSPPSEHHMSRISIQLNRLSSEDSAQLCLSSSRQDPALIVATSFQDNSSRRQHEQQQRQYGEITNLDVRHSKEGKIKIFIKHKNREHRKRLKFWRYFRHISPKKDRHLRRHPTRPTTVHFYSPDLCSQRDDGSKGEQHYAYQQQQQQQPPPSSVAAVPTVDFGLSASSGFEDDLEAYMKEIKLRQNQCGTTVP